MLSTGAVRIVPDQIVFRSTQPGQKESTDIWIHNIGRNPIKIRFSLSQNSNFKLLSQANATLVAGLETKVTVQYVCKKSELINEELSILAADSSIKVPIIAYPPAAQVKLNTEKIEIGNVQVETEIKRKFSIANFGTKETTFSARCSDMGVILTNASGALPIGEAVDVGFIYTPR